MLSCWCLLWISNIAWCLATLSNFVVERGFLQTNLLYSVESIFLRKSIFKSFSSLRRWTQRVHHVMRERVRIGDLLRKSENTGILGEFAESVVEAFLCLMEDESFLVWRILQHRSSSGFLDSSGNRWGLREKSERENTIATIGIYDVSILKNNG